MDFKLEVAAIPVADVERAKEFYKSPGWREDADFASVFFVASLVTDRLDDPMILTPARWARLPRRSTSSTSSSWRRSRGSSWSPTHRSSPRSRPMIPPRPSDPERKVQQDLDIQESIPENNP